MDAMQLKFLAMVSVNGIAVGSIYALLALGFVVIFKATDIFNFAQGEIMMFGAYMAMVLSNALAEPIGILAAFLLAFIIASVTTAALGGLCEMTVVRPMLGKPVLSIIMITLGLSFVLRGGVEFVWGPEELPFQAPFADAPLLLSGIPIAEVRLYTIVVCLCMMGIFFLFFKYSNQGLGMRATAENQETAFLMGINVKRVFTTSWAIAGIVGAVGGIFLVSTVGNMVPYLSHIGLRALPAVILGGMNSITGAIIGGLILGLCENLAGTYIAPHLGGGDIKEITSYVIVLIVMMIRPYGLFGTKEVERV
jgi:branched-chain amino acid transport system permease protein